MEYLATTKSEQRAFLASLGCAKNRVGSEAVLGILRKSGYVLTENPEDADLIIVNTCGFISPAVSESLDEIVELARMKDEGRCKRLIVTGCLLERYGEELKRELPEVDLFVRFADLPRYISGNVNGKVCWNIEEARTSLPIVLSTPSHYAYLKISDGCDRLCAFCTIPSIKGAFRSRNAVDIIKEASLLGDSGVREINLVAQDLTAYGKDLDGTSLHILLESICHVATIEWVRLLYLYPVGIDERLLDLILENNKIVEYMDIPFQHVSEKILKRMKRPLGRYSPKKMVEVIRKKSQDIALRTTFIVGFPGETERDIRELEEFIREGHFMHVGVFEYCDEEGTVSYEYTPKVPKEEISERRARIMEAQADVLQSILRDYVGKELQVIIDSLLEESTPSAVARARFQAPEVDGTVLLPNMEGMPLETGQITDVKIIGVDGYDLIGHLSGCPKNHTAN